MTVLDDPLMLTDACSAAGLVWTTATEPVEMIGNAWPATGATISVLVLMMGHVPVPAVTT